MYLISYPCRSHTFTRGQGKHDQQFFCWDLLSFFFICVQLSDDAALIISAFRINIFGI